MNEVMRDNDILIATLLKPDISNVDLLKNNITLNNTQLLDKETYKSLPGIQKVFTKDGVFNDELFNLIYDLASLKYQQMQDNEMMSNLIDSLEYSQTSFFRKPSDKVASTAYSGTTFKNPLLQLIGLEGVNVKSEPTKTEKEVAQSHTIWDPVNKKWLEDSAETRNIFLKTFGESLIYAKYTKDGYQENPVTKEMDYHQAGEFITDEDGYYFTQLAGNTDLSVNNEIVKLQDILSDEDSWWNKVDFFDSDSLDKSVTGTVMKTLISTIPYFLPYVGPVYTAASILVGLGENLPQIAKSFDWSTNGDTFTKGCNAVVNWFSKFDPSVTKYGQEHFLSVENIGHLTADMVGQLYQQRSLALLSKYIIDANKVEKELGALVTTAQGMKQLEAAALEQLKIAKALAIGYMSVVQAGDVYNDALNAGYSRGVAGLATLMSTAAFFGIMNYNESLNGLGTWFLDKTTGYDREFALAPITKIAKKEVRAFSKSKELQDLYKNGDPRFAGKLREYWLLFWDKVDDAVRIGGEGVWTNALAEGVEEVSEEVVQDGVKGLIDGLNYLGYTTGKWGNEEASFGGLRNVFSLEGLERYVQTFVGGAFGGAMFNITLNRIKPFTDSLFGIESEIPAPINYDLYDIALRGLGDKYMQEVDKAVQFINDRELDLNNPEDNKIYNLREAVAAKLKNDMRTALDLINNIVAGADFDANTISQSFRDRIKLMFKPMVQETGVINYVSKKFEKNTRSLINVLLSILEKEKDLADKKAGIDVEKTKEDIKKLKEEATNLRLSVVGFFTGKSYVDTHDEAAWLINKDLFNQAVYAGKDPSKSVLSDKEYYENVLKKDGGPKFEDLLDRSDDPNVLTKETVNKERTLLVRLLEGAFDDSKLDDLYEQLPIINKAFKAMTKLIGGNITAYSTDAAKRTVISNAIKKMNQERDMLELALRSLDLLTFFTPEKRIEYDLANDEKKQQIMQEVAKSVEEQIVESMSINRLIDLIKNDPNAFSLSERYNIDYLSVLEQNGVITLDPSLTPEQRQVVQTLVNSEFANVPLSTLSKQNVQVILDNILGKLSSDSNYFGLNFKDAAKQEEGATINTNPSLLTFDVNIDNYNDSIEFVKFKDIEDFINTAEGGLNEGLISEDVYRYLLDFYSKRDAEFLLQFSGIDPDLDAAIDAYIKKPTSANKADIVTSLKELTLDQDLLKRLEEILNILIAPGTVVNDEINIVKTAIDSAINSQLKSSDFIESHTGKVIENNFSKAIEKIAFSIGSSAETVRLTVDQLSKWAQEIRDGKGLTAIDSLTADNIKHMLLVLQVFDAVAKTMAPVVDDDGKEYEGILQRNKNFAKSMGQDSEDYHIITSGERNLFHTMVVEMAHKLDMLSSVQSNMEEQQSKQFETVRQLMIDNEFKLFRYHVALKDKDNPLYIEELAKEVEDEGDLEFTIEEKLLKLLNYRQAVYSHIHSDYFGNGIIKEGQDALVKYLMNTYGKTENGNYKNDIFYYGDPATTANNQTDGINAYASYFLNDLIGLAGLDSKYTPKIIEESIAKAFKDTGLYPRQDQAYAIQLALLGILAKEAYSIYGNELANWYNDPKSKGAIKQYILNLIRIPGPAGSGKTALYSLLIKALENLGFNSNIAISAQSDIKIGNILKDLENVKFAKTPEYKGLYTLIPSLKEKNALYRDIETRVFTVLQLNQSEITKSGKEYIVNVNPNDETKGKITYTFNNKIFNVKVTGDLEFDLTIPQGNFENTVINFNLTNLGLSSSIDNGLLIIDECTNLSPFEWHVLDSLAKKSNFNIIATGDQYQRGYAYKLLNRDAFIGDDNILGLNTPALESVHRALSSASIYNEKSIRSIADSAILANKANSHEGLDDYHYDQEAIRRIDEGLRGLKLQYTLSNNKYGLLGANITNSQEELAKTLNSIKKENKPTFLIITTNDQDDATVRKLLSDRGLITDGNVKSVRDDDVQGAEADYAIAYNIPLRGNATSKLQDLKEIYTLVTRGRYGFVSFGDENDVFNGNEVKSTADQPVVVIDSTYNPDEWMSKWENIISQVEDIQSETEQPEEEVLIPEQEHTEEPQPVLEDGDNSRLSGKISQAFTGTDWLIMRQYGYHLGLSLNQIDAVNEYSEMSTENTKALLDTFTDVTPFRSFLTLLNASTLEGLVHAKDVELVTKLLNTSIDQALKAVRSDEIAKRKTSLGVYTEAFIRFINSLREAAEDSLLYAYSFYKKTNANNLPNRDNPDVAYLKVNDDAEKAGTILRTIGIPIFTNDTATGHIALGVIGWDESTDENGNTVSSVSENSWYKTLPDNTIKVMVKSENPDSVQTHLNNLLTYYGSVRFNKNRINGTNHSGPIAKLTNLRDWSIASDWQGNVLSDISLGRITLEDLLALGFEIVQGDDFITGTTDKSQFKGWYEEHRFGGINSIEDFETVLNHDGKYIVVRPKGTTGKGHPILVKKVVSWNDFALNAVTKNGNLSGYGATVMFLALARYLEGVDNKYKDLDFNGMKQALLDTDSRRELIDLISEASPNVNKISDALLRLISNSVINSYDHLNFDGKTLVLVHNPSKTTVANELTPVLKLLEQIAPDYPYISTSKTGDNSKLIVEKVFEQSNNLIDLSMLVEPGITEETPVSVTVEQSVEWGNGLSEHDSRVFNGILNLLNSVQDFNSLDRVDKRNIKEKLPSLLLNLSRSEISEDMTDKLKHAAKLVANYVSTLFPMAIDANWKQLLNNLVDRALAVNSLINEEERQQLCKIS